MSALKNITVTGTKGKSTTINILDSVLADTGYDIGSSTKDESRLNNEVYQRDYTEDYLGVYEDNELDVFLFETPALSDMPNGDYIKDIKSDIAIFTNFDSNEHDDSEAELNFNKDFFSQIKEDGVAIVNDDAVSVTDNFPGRVITVGLTDSADWKYRVLFIHKDVIRFRLTGPGEKHDLYIKTVGAKDVFNYAAVCVSLFEMGYPISYIAYKIESYTPCKKRFEQHELGGNKHIVFDSCQSLDALEGFLQSVKGAYPEHRVITLLTIPEDEYVSKRNPMGRIASENSKWVYISDNTGYYKNAPYVAADMYKGMTRRNATIQLNRTKALRSAIEDHENQVIAVAGFGSDLLTTKRYNDYKRIEEILGKKL